MQNEFDNEEKENSKKDNNKNNKKGKVKAKFLVLAIVVLLIAIGAITYGIYSKNKDENKTVPYTQLIKDMDEGKIGKI